MYIDFISCLYNPSTFYILLHYFRDGFMSSYLVHTSDSFWGNSGFYSIFYVSVLQKKYLQEPYMFRACFVSKWMTNTNVFCIISLVIWRLRSIILYLSYGYVHTRHTTQLSLVLSKCCWLCSIKCLPLRIQMWSINVLMVITDIMRVIWVRRILNWKFCSKSQVRNMGTLYSRFHSQFSMKGEWER